MPRRDEVTREWKRLHDEELHDLCFSPIIVSVIKSRRMRWDWHAARFGGVEGHTGFWWGDLSGKDRLEDLELEGRVIKMNLQEGGRVTRTGLIWLRIGTSGMVL